MRRVEWAAAAIADLKKMEVYLVEMSSTVANREIGGLVSAAEWLLDQPRAGPAAGYRSCRKWKPRGLRHRFTYEPTSFGINVVRVRHERDDWRPTPG